MKRLAGLALAGLLAACAAQTPPPLPDKPQPAGPEIQIAITPVPLDPANPQRTSLNGFTYMGGVAITDPVTNRVHGLSDLKVTPDGRIVTISDFGDLFEAKLQFGQDSRLSGLTDGKLWTLKRPDGQPVQGKLESDAEGLAILANGDRLVSFERDHRIWRYPAAGGPPVAAPKPGNLFSENEGMEGLTEYPFAGPDAYLVGSEEGELWLCKLSTACQTFSVLNGPDLEYGLTALAPFQDGSLVAVHRAWDPVRGSRITVSVYAAAALKGRQPQPMAGLVLNAPLTTDNIEGVALVTSPTGATRLLLLSDDNASDSQRTLLMVFDWTGRK